MSRRRSVRTILTIEFDDTQYENHIAYRVLWKAFRIGIFLMFLSLGGTGCSDQPAPYRPPTIAVRLTQPAKAAVTPPTTKQPVETPLLPTPVCTNNLTFLGDLSLLDGTVVKPGAILDKRWLVENSGTCDWDQYYSLKFISGVELGASLDQSLYPARSGAKAIIRISFTAPSEPGNYQSTWQAYDPQGQSFGDPILIKVTVGSDNP